MTATPLNQKITALQAIRALDTTGYGVANAELAKSIGAKTPAAKARLNIVVHGLRSKKFIVNLHTGIYQLTELGWQEIDKGLAKAKAAEQRAAKAAAKSLAAPQLPAATSASVVVTPKTPPVAHQAGPGALDAILTHLVSSICAELAQQLLPALVQTLDKTIGTAALEIATRPANPIVEVDVSTASAQTSAAVSKAARVDAPIVMPKAPPKFAHFKVAIVGLRGDQVAMIKSEYGGKLDLRFIDGAKNCAADIRVASNQCDHVVAMLDFVSHSDSDVARAGTAKYHGLHGGMSTLRNKLNDIVLAHETRIAAVAA